MLVLKLIHLKNSKQNTFKQFHNQITNNQCFFTYFLIYIFFNWFRTGLTDFFLVPVWVQISQTSDIKQFYIFPNSE